MVFILSFANDSYANKFNFTEGSWEEILDIAKKENKLIFVDFNASWCGPCKWMEKKAFNDKKASNYFNENFINVSVDVDTEMQELVKQIKPRAVPTLMFFNSDGEIVLKDEGALGADLLIDLGKRAKSL